MNKRDLEIEELYYIVNRLAKETINIRAVPGLTQAQHQLIEKATAHSELKYGEELARRARETLAKIAEAEKPKFPTIEEWIDGHEISTWAAKGVRKAVGENGTIIDLVMKTERGLLNEVDGFGRKSLNEVRKLLAFEGLHFGMARESAEKSYTKRE